MQVSKNIQCFIFPPIWGAGGGRSPLEFSSGGANLVYFEWFLGVFQLVWGRFFNFFACGAQDPTTFISFWLASPVFYLPAIWVWGWGGRSPFEFCLCGVGQLGVFWVISRGFSVGFGVVFNFFAQDSTTFISFWVASWLKTALKITQIFRSRGAHRSKRSHGFRATHHIEVFQYAQGTFTHNVLNNKCL